MSDEAPKTRGQKLEGVAFQFCKVATVALILGRWTLPVAAALAAVFYVWAWSAGKRDTRCVLRYPLFIAAFWGVVSVAAFWFVMRGGWG